MASTWKEIALKAPDGASLETGIHSTGTASAISGIIPLANGGTNVAELGTAGDFLVVNAEGTAVDFKALSGASGSMIGYNAGGTFGYHSISNTHNHDSIYVNTTGDTISGSLTVGGALTAGSVNWGDVTIVHVDDTHIILDADNGGSAVDGGVKLYLNNGGSNFAHITWDESEDTWYFGKNIGGSDTRYKIARLNSVANDAGLPTIGDANAGDIAHTQDADKVYIAV